MEQLFAYYHLPGLFEFFDFYQAFLPLYRDHKEYFYDWARIGSIYGAPADCIWGGGRVGFGEARPEAVFDLMDQYQISPRLTFSNLFLKKEHLQDSYANALCKRAQQSKKAPGVILTSDLLLEYLKENYDGFYFVSSTTKVITDINEAKREVRREEFSYVVPDFRFNKPLEIWEDLDRKERDKLEFLCNECCSFACKDRRACYENVSKKALGETVKDHICKAPMGNQGYRFSEAMKNPAFLSRKDIQEVYLPAGFSNFKIEGRGLGSAILLEFLLYYMVKPKWQLKVREELYLDAMLDLF